MIGGYQAWSLLVKRRHSVREWETSTNLTTYLNKNSKASLAKFLQLCPRVNRVPKVGVVTKRFCEEFCEESRISCWSPYRAKNLAFRPVSGQVFRGRSMSCFGCIKWLCRSDRKWTGWWDIITHTGHWLFRNLANESFVPSGPFRHQLAKRLFERPCDTCSHNVRFVPLFMRFDVHTNGRKAFLFSLRYWLCDDDETSTKPTVWSFSFSCSKTIFTKPLSHQLPRATN